MMGVAEVYPTRSLPCPPTPFAMEAPRSSVRWVTGAGIEVLVIESAGETLRIKEHTGRSIQEESETHESLEHLSLERVHMHGGGGPFEYGGVEQKHPIWMSTKHTSQWQHAYQTLETTRKIKRLKQ
jgi:hypothetical protein